MPKLKTNRAAAKRFRVTAKGFKRYSSRRRHNLGDKPRKQKRQLRSGGTTLVHETDVYRIVQLMPHAGITPTKIGPPRSAVCVSAGTPWTVAAKYQGKSSG